MCKMAGVLCWVGGRVLDLTLERSFNDRQHIRPTACGSGTSRRLCRLPAGRPLSDAELLPQNLLSVLMLSTRTAHNFHHPRSGRGHEHGLWTGLRVARRGQVCWGCMVLSCFLGVSLLETPADSSSTQNNAGGHGVCRLP